VTRKGVIADVKTFPTGAQHQKAKGKGLSRALGLSGEGNYYKMSKKWASEYFHIGEETNTIGCSGEGENDVKIRRGSSQFKFRIHSIEYAHRASAFDTGERGGDKRREAVLIGAKRVARKTRGKKRPGLDSLW